MSLSLLQRSSLALALCAVATAAGAQQTVNFTSLDGTTNLTAHLSRPEGDAPRPALVLMHGCSGLLDAKGRILPIYRAWMRAVGARLRGAHRRQRQFARLRPDCSASPHRCQSTCGRMPLIQRHVRLQPNVVGMMSA